MKCVYKQQCDFNDINLAQICHKFQSENKIEHNDNVVLYILGALPWNGAV